MGSQALITGATRCMSTEDSTEGWTVHPNLQRLQGGANREDGERCGGESEEQRSEAGNIREGVPLAGQEPTK